LLDRIDLRLDVQRPSAAELAGGGDTVRSADARARVIEARERQERRSGRCNAQLSANELRDVARVDEAGQRLLATTYEKGVLSARGHHRVLRVARTIADLAGRERVGGQDLALALSLRHDESTRADAA
jgi:magnesium chelatase family protein